MKPRITYLLLFLTVNIIFFIILFLKSYFFKKKFIDFDSLTLINKNYIYFKEKYIGNDGMIFYNQDKIIYKGIIQNSHKHISDNTEKTRKQISHNDVLRKLSRIQDSNKRDKDMNKSKQNNTVNNKDIFSILND